MNQLPSYLKKLERRLAAMADDHDVMILSELDGFLAGIVVCPDLVMPGEWLPLIWGRDESEHDAVFETAEDLQDTVSLVMRHYNSIAQSLHRGGEHYRPIFDVDQRHDEVLWEIWLEGFVRAMGLRPESWPQILSDDDEEAKAALSLIIALSGTDEEASIANEDELIEVAHELIPRCVVSLSDWRLRSGLPPAAAMPSTTGTKVGRNDPCPCGSGKKYKRCCGLN